MARSEPPDLEGQRLHARVASQRAQLSEDETRWRDRYLFLQSKGYILRPRYFPHWVPSWQGQDKLVYSAEDAIVHPFRPNLVDATRSADGHLVYIKRVETDGHEIKIASMFSEDGLRDDPDNHCVPILDCFVDDKDPTISYIVMPFLRLMDDPPFWLVNDVVDFTDQILEGLVYMHAHGVAHRDCARKNLMMDALVLYPHGFHPIRVGFLPNLSDFAKPRPRISAPVRYYYVDFGISVHIPPEVQPKRALGGYGQDQEVPELSFTEPYDPFKVDVFILGNVFRKEICAKFSNVGFMGPLVKSMTSLNPEERPDAASALRQWRQLRGHIFLLHRGWRLRGQSENVAKTLLFDVVHFMKLGILLSRHFLVWTSRLLALVRRIL